MKKRFVREGDALADDASVVVRGGELDPVILSADAERYFAVYGTFGISVLAVRDITFENSRRDRRSSASNSSPW